MKYPSTWMDAEPLDSASSKAATQRSAPRDVAVARREHLVDRADLFGVDAELALEPEIAGQFGGAAQRVYLTEMDEHRVDGRFEPGRARFDADRGPGVVQLALVDGPPHPHVEGVVTGSEREAANTSARTRDFAQRDHAATGLDDRQQIDAAFGQTAGSFERRDGPVHGHELGGGLDLRQRDPVDPGGHHRLEILEAQRGVECVDPDVAESPARLLERGDDLLARGVLLGDCDGVLEIEDHHIRVERERLFDTPGVIARREQQRSEDQHGDSKCAIEHEPARGAGTAAPVTGPKCATAPVRMAGRRQDAARKQAVELPDRGCFPRRARQGR